MGCYRRPQVVFKFYQPYFLRGGVEGELKAAVSYFLKRDLGTYYDLGAFEIVSRQPQSTDGGIAVCLHTNTALGTTCRLLMVAALFMVTIEWRARADSRHIRLEPWSNSVSRMFCCAPQ